MCRNKSVAVDRQGTPSRLSLDSSLLAGASDWELIGKTVFLWASQSVSLTPSSLTTELCVLSSTVGARVNPKCSRHTVYTLHTLLSRAHTHARPPHTHPNQIRAIATSISAWPLALHVLCTIEPERFLLNDLLLRLQQLRVHLNRRRIVDIVAHAPLVVLEHIALAGAGEE